jgi:hypothetical protein
MSSHPAEEAGRRFKIGREHGGISEKRGFGYAKWLANPCDGGNRENDPQNSM